MASQFTVTESTSEFQDNPVSPNEGDTRATVESTRKCRHCEPLDVSFMTEDLFNIVLENEPVYGVDGTGQDPITVGVSRPTVGLPVNTTTRQSQVRDPFTERINAGDVQPDSGESIKVEENIRHSPNADQSERPVTCVEVADAAGTDDVQTFQKFASTYFQGGATPEFTRRKLTKPLLVHSKESDRSAAIAVWTMILGFMESRPEPNKTVPCSETLDWLSSLSSDLCSGQMDARNAPNETTGVNKETRNYANDKNNNPTPILIRKVRAEGWFLLALCTGCFVPSERLLPSFRHFVQTYGPPEFVDLCLHRLERTLANGIRRQPPGWAEVCATRMRQDMQLSITLMDNRTVLVHADAATMASEVCASVADQIGLQDRFGFSLYIGLLNKVSSLGNSNDHLMDAISQCEKFIEGSGPHDPWAPWNLYFRKELFTPWHDPSIDPVATDLIYHQVALGLVHGEYLCDKHETVCFLLACKYHVETFTQFDMNINPIQLDSEDIKTWLVKQNCRWVTDPASTRSSYPSLLTLTTVQNTKYTLYSSDSDEICELIIRFLTGLKERSIYVVAVQEVRPTDVVDGDQKLLFMNYGDLIVLRPPVENSHLCSENHPDSCGLSLVSEPLSPVPFLHEHLVQLGESTGGLCCGENQRTRQVGEFPAKFVYILPTLTFPTPKMLILFDSTSSVLTDGDQTLTDLDDSSLKSIPNVPSVLYMPMLSNGCGRPGSLGKLQAFLDSLSASLAMFGMRFASSKCKMLLLLDPAPNLILTGEVVEEVYKFCYLSYISATSHLADV
ncbi:unnamed protein product [Echinostoma caproni]|uniref:MyTH4 domain-containing protein n=1 Tax=Echinostoma caproni TaxID=27848 RepID=A0A183AHH2_9TREM|nr:unnamed protein product [Echinostoma caproni]